MLRTAPTAHRRLRGAVTPRVLALMLCVPLIGGRGLALMIDAFAYPYGACCCERAHGAVHHCRCADPHEGEEADAAHQLGLCPDQCDDGGAEFGVPNLWAMPLATLPAPPVLNGLEALRRERHRPRVFLGALSPPPPTPPPNSPLV